MSHATPPPPTWQDLAGRYTLRPGQATPVQGHRGVLAPGQLARLLAGQDMLQTQRSLGHLFTLCAHAHQRALRLAMQAACTPGRAAETSDGITQLTLETARDQLRTMALDWPRRTGSQAPDLRWLAGCPLPLAQTPLPQDHAACNALANRTCKWLHGVLGQSPQDWLSASVDERWLRRWCADAADRAAPIAALAHWAQQPVLQGIHTAMALNTRAAGVLDALDVAMTRQPAFSQHPQLPSGCAETGPWTRGQHGPSSSSQLALSPWQRLAARWRDLVACLVSVGQGAPCLSVGTHTVRHDTALAWVEMARGVLLYRVTVDAAYRLTDIRIIAPTEWNFHPHGCLARHLRALSADAFEDAQSLAMAWDACVECVVDDNHPHEETKA